MSERILLQGDTLNQRGRWFNFRANWQEFIVLWAHRSGLLGGCQEAVFIWGTDFT